MSITFPIQDSGNTCWDFANYVVDAANAWTPQVTPGENEEWEAFEARQAERTERVEAYARAMFNAVDPEDHTTLGSLVDAMMAVPA